MDNDTFYELQEYKRLKDDDINIISADAITCTICRANAKRIKKEYPDNSTFAKIIESNMSEVTADARDRDQAYIDGILTNYSCENIRHKFTLKPWGISRYREVLSCTACHYMMLARTLLKEIKGE